MNMMLVPDVRQAKREVAERAVEAATRMSQGVSSRYLYQGFGLPDRRQLDDAVLEMIGIEDVGQRAGIQRRIYEAIQEQYIATWQRELVAQRHRRQSQRKGTPSATEMAEDIWEEHRESLDLLQFPESFVHSWAGGEYFDLPDGQVEVGTAMMDTGRQLRVGTIRSGGSTGPVLDVGSLEKARFLQALAESGHYGSVRVPDDKECEGTYREFARYKQDLARRFAALTTQRTRDKRRQHQIVAALMRKALA